jgi:transcriptional regulator with XRE-family HTH domain
MTYAAAMTDRTETFGARIRAARRARGWTQDDLAKAVGVTRSAVAQWETDRAGQIRDNLARIAMVLGVPVAALLGSAPADADLRAVGGDELALLRLYRACSPEDRAFLLRTARRLAILLDDPQPG